MKITARAVQASFTVTDEAGNTVAEYSVENMNFVTDISGLLKCVSQAAHLFKQLDASHNVDVTVNTQGERERAPVMMFDRSKEQQALINAASDFMHVCARLIESDTQHEAGSDVYSALREMRRDASAENTRALADAAALYMALVGDAGERIKHRANKLTAAINAI